jgi:hypothetical protein
LAAELKNEGDESMRPRSRILKVLAGLISMAILVAVLAQPPASIAQTEDETGDEYSLRLQEIYGLRSNGKYDQAMAELRRMIEEYSNAAEFQRQLYNELVLTVHQKLNATPDSLTKAELEREREALARETLKRYPDIEAGTGLSGLDALYDALRAEMFGRRLEIITDPDSCDVMIDGAYMGKSPYQAQYFPIGAHTLRIIKSGYEESEVAIEVEPDGTFSKEIDLKKIKGKGWWLTRVVTPVAVGVGIILAFALSGSDEQPPDPPDEPLPGPPDPPTN